MRNDHSPLGPQRLGLAAVTLGCLSALLVGCGTQSGLTPATGAEAGCDRSVAKIAEPTEFTSYEDRRSTFEGHPPAPKAVDPEVLHPPYAKSVAGLPASAMILENKQLTLMYTNLPPEKATRDAVLAEGGAVLSSASTEDGTDVVAEMTSVIGERAVPVEVGPYKAVLTWADPDENGLRPHHVTWVEGSESYELVLDRSAEGSVAAARSLVCP